MQVPILKCEPFEQSEHFLMKEKAFEYFFAKTQDYNEAKKMSNLVYNIKVLKSEYSPNIHKQVGEFFEQLDEDN